MKGLELAEKYYYEVCRPVLAEKFPELLPRLAAGLAGEGSECFGFDDGISCDHDFGPGFCLWITEKDAGQYFAPLQEAYDALPGFMGMEKRRSSAPDGKRLGVFTVQGWYYRFIGGEQPPRSQHNWLRLKEEQLAACTNGKIFEDNAGEFTSLRRAIRYYPEPVRIRRIVSAAFRMAQSGQYNFARCMQRGETVAASLAKAEFIKETVQMLCLLNEVYAPYYKWAFRSLAGQKRLAVTHPLIRELAELPVADKTAAESTDLIGQICAYVIIELQRQDLTDSPSDFLVDHCDSITERYPEINE